MGVKSKMIIYKKGDIFKEEVEAIVNAVNCVGVMGRGIALQFKKRFPDNFKDYEEACRRKEVVPGKMFVHENNYSSGPKYIVNFPSKRHWRESSYIEDIELGLYNLSEVIDDFNIKSIALPPIGCGLGGLDWNKVRDHIEMKLSHLLDVDIIVFEPWS